MKKGFTLAEVLITLGIIGVVAAMTIPTLVANYQAKSWSTSATVFERKLEEALKVMNTQQTLAGYTTTEAFVDELKKHIKILKTCDNTELEKCFPETFTYGFPETETMDITTFTDSSKLRKEPYGTNTVGVQFANGVAAVLAYDPTCKQDPYSNQITGTGCISMIYDTSGAKSPNQSNKDLRMLNVNKLYAFKIGGTKFSAPFKPTPITSAECQSLKGDLGINLCSYSSDYDYWAGAVKECGGISKMPTEEQLKDIAFFVYNGTLQCPEYTNCQDTNKVQSLGFKHSTVSYIGLYFSIWSNKEFPGSEEGVSNLGFSLSAASFTGNMDRSTQDSYALCIE